MSGLLWKIMIWTWEHIHSFEIIISFPLAIYTKVGLLDHMTVLLLIFWGTYTIFYNRKWLHQFTFPPTVHKGSFYSTFDICIPCSFDNRHHTSIRWYLVVVSIWISSIIRDAKYLSVYFVYDMLFVYTLWKKMSVQALCPFLTKLLFFWYWVA